MPTSNDPLLTIATARGHRIGAAKLLYVLGITSLLSIWGAQNSINAYWQQTYHQDSPLSALERYPLWRLGGELQDLATDHYQHLTDHIADIDNRVEIAQENRNSDAEQAAITATAEPKKTPYNSAQSATENTNHHTTLEETTTTTAQTRAETAVEKAIENATKKTTALNSASSTASSNSAPEPAAVSTNHSSSTATPTSEPPTRPIGAQDLSQIGARDLSQTSNTTPAPKVISLAQFVSHKHDADNRDYIGARDLTKQSSSNSSAITNPISSIDNSPKINSAPIDKPTAPPTDIAPTADTTSAPIHQYSATTSNAEKTTDLPHAAINQPIERPNNSTDTDSSDGTPAINQAPATSDTTTPPPDTTISTFAEPLTPAQTTDQSVSAEKSTEEGTEETAPTTSSHTASSSDITTLHPGDKVFFAGDSLMQGVAPHVQKMLKSQYNIMSIDLSKQSTGLSYPKFYDWPAIIEKTLNNDNHIKLLVIFLGPNDPWDIPNPKGGKYLKFKSPEWEAEYKQRINRILDAAEQHHVNVIWLGLPFMKNKKLNAQMLYLDNLLRETTQQRVTYISTKYNLTAGAEQFTDPVIINGKKTFMRTKDGIHFTPSGQKLIAELIKRRLSYQPN